MVMVMVMVMVITSAKLGHTVLCMFEWVEHAIVLYINPVLYILMLAQLEYSTVWVRSMVIILDSNSEDVTPVKLKPGLFKK